VVNSQEGINSNFNNGDTEINTGNVNNTGNISTFANNNLSSQGSLCCSGNGASVINNQNGALSNNSGSATLANNNTTSQTNGAIVGNNLNNSSVSGNNSASFNNGNSTITTGDANTAGTIVTAVNTNVDGVAVSEFNVVDNHTGDIILDFAANCVSGCGEGALVAQNSNNGAGSVNDASIGSLVANITDQNNQAQVSNNLTLFSDSGNNSASYNTGGDSNITTGDANVLANVLSFVNNNLSGNVVFGVVNIFGNLIGDIILPESQIIGSSTCSTCGNSLTAANTSNGTGSTNTSAINNTINNATFQNNDALIDNNLILSANTGDNSSSFNTGGNSNITTGDANVSAQVLNIANSNISGGTWWLVIVNKAGQWIGQILGAPEGSNYAGSAGTEFIVNENGEIIAVNSGNGSGSTNTADVSSITNNTLVQNNNANIVNNLNLSANTGGNTTNYNTGGNSNITTGDAKIIANLINFVNNNITGGGKLVVTFVNVFGSWIGDFVTPGSQKRTTNSAVGGVYSQENFIPGSSPQISEDNSVGKNNSQENNSEEKSPIVAVAGNSTGIKMLAKVANGIAEVRVASINKSVGAANSQKAVKKITINLAWIVLTAPIILLLYLAGKKYLFKYLPRKKEI